MQNKTKFMTSIEWLINELTCEYAGQRIVNFNQMTDVSIYCEQAKEMHKEEMRLCASFWRGKENEIEKTIFNEYYNETFKNQQQWNTKKQKQQLTILLMP